MLDTEDIYCYLVSGLTRIEFSEMCMREPEIRTQLHNLLENAEVMHLCIGFQEEAQPFGYRGVMLLLDKLGAAMTERG